MYFSTYLREWLRNKRPMLEVSTYEAYEIYICRHLAPYFEKLAKDMRDIKPKDIRAYVTEKLTGGRKDGKPGGLSRVSVQKHLNIIKQAFSDAVIEEETESNPAQCIKLPRADSMSERSYFLTVEEARRVLTAFEGHPMEELIAVTLIYGLRRSEALGLKWDAVDFENHSLAIRHTVVKNCTVVRKDRTKTASSRRTYELLPDIAELLQGMRERQQYERAQAKVRGVPYEVNDYLFKWPDGKPFRPDYVTRALHRILRRNGLHDFRFHDLRHGTASILFDRGWTVKDVQVWMGHSDIETTLNIYTHYGRGRKIRVGSDIGEILSLTRKAE